MLSSADDNICGTTLPENLSGVHFHFVGIKGTGMAALVEILSARGAVITGSDVSERFYTDEVLERVGIKALPFSASNVDASVDFVVHSSAYSAEKNPDLAEAARLGIPTMLYSEALGAVSATAFSSGVCGVHGKTTTTGLVGTILKEFDLPSQVLAGSVISSFGDSCTMTSGSFGSPSSSSAPSEKYFVAETCEYQRHFMAFHPKKIILTSVESDHQDYYPTYEDIRDAFVDYILKLPEGGTLVYCADDKGAVETAKIALSKRSDIRAVPYGVAADGDFKLTFSSVEGGRHSFSLAGFGEFSICVPGDHNVRNAAAAVALCVDILKSAGKSRSEILDKYVPLVRQGLLKFAGGKRRSEIVGKGKTANGEDVIFIDDYGHHPTAVKTTLAGFREFYKNHKIIVDFMSHTYTRTAALLDEFASSFGSADCVIVNKIYGSAREDASAAKVTGEMLAERTRMHHPSVVYAGEFDEAEKAALSMLSKPSGAKDGYLFVTMGAGDNWKVGRALLEKLGVK
jgi:UDP-N-acetylmuramate--alanine ligase